MTLYAHTGNNPDRSDWQTLTDHTQGVVDLARKYALEVFPKDSSLIDQVELAAWLHDLGKCRPGFQRYLRGEVVAREKTYHKQVGAYLSKTTGNLIASWVIAGHHGGLPGNNGLKELLASPAATEGWQESVGPAKEHCKRFPLAPPKGPEIKDTLVAETLIRLAFSILVDADGTDTGRHDAKVKGWTERPGAPALAPETDLANLLNYVSIRAARVLHTPTRLARETVLQDCLTAAESPPGLFTLTVPTGGGKTLSGLAFALKHAALYYKRRIVIAAPYLTILEQTADVVAAALGRQGEVDYILEHHGLADAEENPSLEGKYRGRRGERWDSPIVITSNVQFWESLFSNKPGRCRKVHRLTNAVILLDEAQCIPPGYFIPVCAMLEALAQYFNSTVVLCTATQPAWSKRPGFEQGLAGIQEITSNAGPLFQALKRVNVTWPERDETWDWEKAAREMLSRQQVLAIVNTRKAAAELVTSLQRAGCETVFHLSTGLCPSHRRKVLEEVRSRLVQQQPCYLVSTQVIEAGVDIDFPVVLREMAPLEGILQAAGRCNREGRLNLADGTPGGKVRVFRSEKGSLPPDKWYKAGRSVLETIYLSAGKSPQPDDPALIHEYFKHLHASGNLDSNEIQSLRARLDFPQVADRFRLIDDGGIGVVVATWSECQGEVAGLLEQAINGDWKAQKRLDAFKVNLRQHELEKHAGWMREESPGLFVYRGPYDDLLGLLKTESTDSLLVI